MFGSKSPAKAPPSPRPTAQQNTKLLHALFLNEENKQNPYTRRPSTSTPSQSEPTSLRTSQDQSQRTSQDGNVHVVRQEEGGLRGSYGGAPVKVVHHHGGGGMGMGGGGMGMGGGHGRRGPRMGGGGFGGGHGGGGYGRRSGRRC